MASSAYAGITMSAFFFSRWRRCWRIVSEEASAPVPWSWGVNGFFTVIGTITAQILGMSFGFSTVLLAGALCYLIALAAIATSNKVFTRRIAG